MPPDAVIKLELMSDSILFQSVIISEYLVIRAFVCIVKNSDVVS